MTDEISGTSWAYWTQGPQGPTDPLGPQEPTGLQGPHGIYQIKHFGQTITMGQVLLDLRDLIGLLDLRYSWAF